MSIVCIAYDGRKILRASSLAGCSCWRHVIGTSAEADHGWQGTHRPLATGSPTIGDRPSTAFLSETGQDRSVLLVRAALDEGSSGVWVRLSSGTPGARLRREGVAPSSGDFPSPLFIEGLPFPRGQTRILPNYLRFYVASQVPGW